MPYKRKSFVYPIFSVHAIYANKPGRVYIYNSIIENFIRYWVRYTEKK